MRIIENQLKDSLKYSFTCGFYFENREMEKNYLITKSKTEKRAFLIITILVIIFCIHMLYTLIDFHFYNSLSSIFLGGWFTVIITEILLTFFYFVNIDEKQFTKNRYIRAMKLCLMYLAYLQMMLQCSLKPNVYVFSTVNILLSENTYLLLVFHLSYFILIDCSKLVMLTHIILMIISLALCITINELNFVLFIPSFMMILSFIASYYLSHHFELASRNSFRWILINKINSDYFSEMVNSFNYNIISIKNKKIIYANSNFKETSNTFSSTLKTNLSQICNSFSVIEILKNIIYPSNKKNVNRTVCKINSSKLNYYMKIDSPESPFYISKSINLGNIGTKSPSPYSEIIKFKQNTDVKSLALSNEVSPIQIQECNSFRKNSEKNFKMRNCKDKNSSNIINKKAILSKYLNQDKDINIIKEEYENNDVLDKNETASLKNSLEKDRVYNNKNPLLPNSRASGNSLHKIMVKPTVPKRVSNSSKYLRNINNEYFKTNRNISDENCGINKEVKKEDDEYKDNLNSEMLNFSLNHHENKIASTIDSLTPKETESNEMPKSKYSMDSNFIKIENNQNIIKQHEYKENDNLKKSSKKLQFNLNDKDSINNDGENKVKENNLFNAMNSIKKSTTKISVLSNIDENKESNPEEFYLNTEENFIKNTSVLETERKAFVEKEEKESINLFKKEEDTFPFFSNIENTISSILDMLQNNENEFFLSSLTLTDSKKQGSQVISLLSFVKSIRTCDKENFYKDFIPNVKQLEKKALETSENYSSYSDKILSQDILGDGYYFVNKNYSNKVTFEEIGVFSNDLFL